MTGFERTYAGLQVLDLSENIAGPLAALIFADMGADVIKVERPGTGEATRGLPPRWPAGADAGGNPQSESTVFLALNRNKRSVALDLRAAAGKEAVLRLAERSDVVVESFRPGVADRLGLGFDALSARNPSVVHCAVNAFGTGPLGYDRPGYDALVQAFTGIMEMTGEPDGGPARAAPSILDITTGMWAAMSIMAALKRRDLDPTAQSLESTLIDSGLFLQCHQIMGYLGAGTFPGRLGTAAPSASPYQSFRTQDQPIMIATSTDRMYGTLCRALGLTQLPNDARFTAQSDRITRRAELADLLEAALMRMPRDHWLDVLAAAGIPVSPVQDLAAALADPLTQERGLIADAAAGGIPGLKQVHLPMDRDRSGARRPPPRLGEDTAGVLREIGLDPADFQL